MSFFSSVKKYLPAFILFTAAYWLIEKNGFSVLLTCLRPLLAAIFIIYLLEPVVCTLEDSLRLPRLWALLLTYLALFLFLGLLIFLLLPDLLHAITDLLTSLPASADSYLKPLLAKLPDLLGSLLGLLASVSALLSSFGTLFIALIMAFYFLLSHHTLGEAIAAFFQPLPASARLLSVLALFNRTCRSFISSKLLLSLIQGLAIFFSTWLCNLLFHLSIPSPLFFGLLTFIANLIPLLGPILGAILCGALALLYGLPEFIVTISLILLWQQIDNLLLSPRLLSGSSGLSPFWILAAVTAASSLGNLWLLLMAVPLTAFAQSIFRAWREKK